MADRTTKFLLALIAIGLWGLLLRPLFALPVQAAPPVSTPPTNPAITVASYNGLVYVVDNKTLYRISDNGREDFQITNKIQLR